MNALGTVTSRFSPRPRRVLANLKVAIVALDGPSHSSAVIGSMRSTRTFGSSGPPGSQMSSVFLQISFAWRCRVSQKPGR